MLFVLSLSGVWVLQNLFLCMFVYKNCQIKSFLPQKRVLFLIMKRNQRAILEHAFSMRLYWSPELSRVICFACLRQIWFFFVLCLHIVCQHLGFLSLFYSIWCSFLILSQLCQLLFPPTLACQIVISPWRRFVTFRHSRNTFPLSREVNLDVSLGLTIIVLCLYYQ